MNHIPSMTYCDCERLSAKQASPLRSLSAPVSKMRTDKDGAAAYLYILISFLPRRKTLSVVMMSKTRSRRLFQKLEGTLWSPLQIR